MLQSAALAASRSDELLTRASACLSDPATEGWVESTSCQPGPRVRLTSYTKAGSASRVLTVAKYNFPVFNFAEGKPFFEDVGNCSKWYPFVSSSTVVSQGVASPVSIHEWKCCLGFPYDGATVPIAFGSWEQTSGADLGEGGKSANVSIVALSFLPYFAGGAPTSGFRPPEIVMFLERTQRGSLQVTLVSEVETPPALLAARSPAYPQAGIASLAGKVMISIDRFVWLSVFKRLEECSLDLHTDEGGGSPVGEGTGKNRSSAPVLYECALDYCLISALETRARAAASGNRSSDSGGARQETVPGAAAELLEHVTAALSANGRGMDRAASGSPGLFLPPPAKRLDAALAALGTACRSFGGRASRASDTMSEATVSVGGAAGAGAGAIAGAGNVSGPSEVSGATTSADANTTAPSLPGSLRVVLIAREEDAEELSTLLAASGHAVSAVVPTLTTARDAVASASATLPGSCPSGASLDSLARLPGPPHPSGGGSGGAAGPSDVQAVLLDDRSGVDIWDATGAFLPLDVPVVVLSQSGEPEVVERAILAGACKFVHAGGGGAADALAGLSLAVSAQRSRLGKRRAPARPGAQAQSGRAARAAKLEAGDSAPVAAAAALAAAAGAATASYGGSGARPGGDDAAAAAAALATDEQEATPGVQLQQYQLLQLQQQQQRNLAVALQAAHQQHPQSAAPAAQKQKKQRVIWRGDLHAKFVAAVEELGIHKAMPKAIQKLMGVPGLERDVISSHLQQYRVKVLGPDRALRRIPINHDVTDPAKRAGAFGAAGGPAPGGTAVYDPTHGHMHAHMAGPGPLELGAGRLGIFGGAPLSAVMQHHPFPGAFTGLGMGLGATGAGAAALGGLVGLGQQQQQASQQSGSQQQGQQQQQLQLGGPELSGDGQGGASSPSRGGGAQDGSEGAQGEGSSIVRPTSAHALGASTRPQGSVGSGQFMPGLQSSLFGGMGLSGVSPSMHAMGVSSMSAYGSSFNPALFAHLGTLQRPVPHSNSTQAAATRMLEAQLMASSQGGQSGQPSAGTAGSAAASSGGAAAAAAASPWTRVGGQPPLSGLQGFNLGHTDSFTGQDIFTSSGGSFAQDALHRILNDANVVQSQGHDLLSSFSGGGGAVGGGQPRVAGDDAQGEAGAASGDEGGLDDGNDLQGPPGPAV